MALALDDKWIWDFWLVQDGADHHLFFLQAPKIGDPESRHWHGSIGHAVSSDLTNWTLLPDALAPGKPGTFDDKATWTGSVVARPGGGWAMLYTGAAVNDNGQIQRIGLATSEDLLTWTKHPTPVSTVDPLLYETLAHGNWFDQAWRDPYVWVDGVEDESAGQFHMLVTARRQGGRALDRGTLAHATSPDLLTWTATPPVTAAMGFGQMEVSQLLEHDGRWYLIFSSDVETQAPLRQGLGTGTFYLVGPSALGPFPPDSLGTLQADTAGSTYGGRVVATASGLQFLAWNRADAEGELVGTIGDPRPVSVDSDGRLSVS